MNDATTTLEELKVITQKFVDERNWRSLNTPKNLSSALVVEAAELMELFLWVDGEKALEELEKHREEVEHELSDILMNILCFSAEHSINLASAYERKLKLTGLKYPPKKY